MTQSATTIFLFILCHAYTLGGELWVDQYSNSAHPDGSKRSPFTSIKAATAQAKPGTTIYVRRGVYRESVRLPNGTENNRISLRAVEGERVEITGADPVLNWKLERPGVYSAEVKYPTETLLLDGRALPIARYPNDGWLTIDVIQNNRIQDTGVPLLTDNASLVGSKVFGWASKGNIDISGVIDEFDRTNRSFHFESSNKTNQLEANDPYRLENSPEWIDLPGEWAVSGKDDTRRVWFSPREEGDLQRVEAVARTTGVILGSYCELSGLIVSGHSQYGVLAQKADHVEIRNCIVAENAVCGVWLRNVQHATVQNNTVERNRSGIAAYTCADVKLFQNDIGYNGADGLLVVWGSRDITVSENYIHHQLGWAHPDGIQIYRDVADVKIKNNLILANGQSLHIQQATNISLEGNTIVGSEANSITFGRAPGSRFTIQKNTIGFSGYQLLNVESSEYQLTENVLVTGHTKPIQSIVDGYEGRKNWYWNVDGAENPMIVSFRKKILRSWRSVENSEMLEQGSSYSNPQFNNAPIAFDAADTQKSSNSLLYIRSFPNLFHVGDYIETNFDGVPRKITSASKGRIEIEPALEKMPRCLAIANWGKSQRFELNLQNKSGVGASIQVEQFRNVDFDGDGVRDCPVWTAR